MELAKHIDLYLDAEWFWPWFQHHCPPLHAVADCDEGDAEANNMRSTWDLSPLFQLEAPREPPMPRGRSGIIELRVLCPYVAVDQGIVLRNIALLAGESL